MRGRRGQLRGHIVQEPPGRSPVSSLDRGGSGGGGARKAFLSCLLSGQSHFAPGQQQEKVPH